MRNTFIAIAVVVLIAGFIGGLTVARARYIPFLTANSAAIIAKDAEINKLKKENKAVKMAPKLPIFYMVQNGKLVKDDNGKMTAVSKDIILSTETKILRDGTVVYKSGIRAKLSEKEFIGER